MSTDIRFLSEVSSRQIDASSDLLRAHRLWTRKGSFPGHPDWSDMAIDQIRGGEKSALVCWINDLHAALLVYQRDKEDSTVLEAKFFNVAEWARGQRIGDFMFRRLEVVGPVEYPGTTLIRATAKLADTAMVGFAMHNGMATEVVPPIEGNFPNNREPDVVLTKPLLPQGDHLLYSA